MLDPNDLPEPWRSRALERPPLWHRVRTALFVAASYALAGYFALSLIREIF